MNTTRYGGWGGLRRLRQTVLACALSLMGWGVPVAIAEVTVTPVKAMQEAETAYFVEDRAAIENLITRIESWARSNRNLEAYAYAYSQFRLLQLAVMSKDDKTAKQAGARCVDTLERSLKTQPEFAEGHALQSACYGYLANLGGFAAIRNGSRSGKAIEVALGLAATNPRVQLIDGFGVYFRPAFVGGDKAQGCQRFSAAAEAFGTGAADRASALGGYDWGAAEAFYFKGRCARDAGDKDGAAAAFTKARELAPQFKRAIRASGG